MTEAGRPDAAEAAAASGWWVLTAVLAGVALGVGAFGPATALDWQPALARSEPWRWFSAAGVHYSGLHLAANLAGLVLVGAFGAAAQVPRRLTLAWALAWPLTHLGLLAQPALLHYGGLSGVLHAGVALVGLRLLTSASPRQAPGALGFGGWRWLGSHRGIGAAVLMGLLAKVLAEAPWGAPLRQAAGWDIAIAPWGHASGVAAGALAFAATAGWRGRRPARMSAP